MRQVRPVAAVALAALLLTAGCFGTANGVADAGAAQITNQANAQPNGNAGTSLQVSATGSVAADPDQAIVRVAVVETGDDAAIARQRLAENVSRMRSALTELGLEDGQISTARYDLDQDYRSEERRDPRYRAVHAFQITLTDLDRVGTVIDTAVENGASQVDNVQYTLSEERRRNLRTDALSEAMSDARGQADAIASSADLTVTGVHRVSTSDVGYRPYTEQVAMAGGAANADTKIDRGSVTVTARVVVVYNASQTA
jgi:hypothetical protein